MKQRDEIWFALVLLLFGLGVWFVSFSMGSESAIAISVISFQTALTLGWILWSRHVENQQVAILGVRQSAPAEQVRTLSDVVESTQAAASNSLIATGIILSAAVLVHNAAQFGDPTSNASELLAVAPKAFTATGFGLACGLLLMVRAHFGALKYLAGIRPTSTSAAGTATNLADIGTTFRDIATTMSADHKTQQDTAKKLQLAIDSISSLVIETKKQLPESTLGKLTAATENLSSDVKALCDAVDDLRDMLKTQSKAIQDKTRGELHDAIVNQATASLDAFRETLISKFGQNLEQITGKVEARIENVAKSAQQSVEMWRPEMDTALAGMKTAIEQKANDTLNTLKNNADTYFEKRVDVVLNDVRVAESNLDGVVAHLRDINQSLTLLLAGLGETRKTLATFVSAAESETGTNLPDLINELSELAESVNGVGLTLLHEFNGLEARRAKVRALRDQISQALSEN